VYESIPFVLGVRRGRAWGLFFNNSHRSTFNMGAGNHRYWSFAADAGRMDYFFFYGPAVPDVVREYTALTGRSPMPPMWALGFQQSRWSYYPDSEVLALARTFRTKNIPADVIYLDIHYMDGYRVFTWDPERFPDPAATLKKLDSMGFKIVTIIDPGVKQDPSWAVAREGLANDHFVRYPDGEVFVGSVWPGRSYFPDFSRQATRDWWAAHLARVRETGVRGFWNDMNEPAVWGKAFPLEVLMDDGGRMSSQKKMHNLYGFLMAKGTYEGLRRLRPDERPFVLTRAGFAGIQRYSAVWTGDNVATNEHLELGIRMLLGLGLSGVPFVGTDVGGFVGTPSPELFARWMQVGAYSPFFRAHTTANTPDQEPWSFGELVEDIVREAISTRYRMLPFLYSLFHEAHETGAPILRPLFWHAQDDSMAYDPAWQHQFTVGRDLLVAPVTREGLTLQRVYLPRGRWLEMGTGRVHQGPAVVAVDAPLERIPTFLRAGGIVPMGEPMQYVGEKPSGVLTLQLFEGDPAAAFELYEDDGTTFAHEKGAYRTTRFTARRASGALRIAREIVHDGWTPPARAVEIRLLGVQAAPSSVTLGSTTLRSLAGADATGNGFRWDGATRVLTVRFEAAGTRQEVTVR
jgi:alpha-glucosidase